MSQIFLSGKINNDFAVSGHGNSVPGGKESKKMIIMATINPRLVQLLSPPRPGLLHLLLTETSGSQLDLVIEDPFMFIRVLGSFLDGDFGPVGASFDADYYFPAADADDDAFADRAGFYGE